MLTKVNFAGDNRAEKAEVGMPVAIKFSHHSFTYGMIVKITPKGFIDVTFDHNVSITYRFNSLGDHISGGYVGQYPAYLVTAGSAKQFELATKLAVTAASAINAVHVQSGADYSKNVMQQQLAELQTLLDAARIAVEARNENA